MLGDPLTDTVSVWEFAAVKEGGGVEEGAPEKDESTVSELFDEALAEEVADTVWEGERDELAVALGYIVRVDELVEEADSTIESVESGEEESVPLGEPPAERVSDGVIERRDEREGDDVVLGDVVGDKLLLALKEVDGLVERRGEALSLPLVRRLAVDSPVKDSARLYEAMALPEKSGELEKLSVEDAEAQYDASDEPEPAPLLETRKEGVMEAVERSDEEGLEHSLPELVETKEEEVVVVSEGELVTDSLTEVVHDALTLNDGSKEKEGDKEALDESLTEEEDDGEKYDERLSLKLRLEEGLALELAHDDEL
jgi:hypothetical protein